MLKKYALGFGTLAKLADSSGYSPSYFKKQFRSSLPVLGRMKKVQGMPALRCSESFLVGAKKIAKSLPAGKRGFFVGQNGLETDAITDSDFIQFSLKGGEIIVHSVQLGGRIFFMKDATLVSLGGS